MEAEDSWSGSTGTQLIAGRFLGVPGYAPRHFGSRDALLAEYGDRLRGVRGQRLRRSFVVCERGLWPALRGRLYGRESDGWWRDGPVVLDFGVTRLELAGFKFNLCVSWDLIDVAEPIAWEGCRLEWREDALPELARLRGRAIDTVRIVDHRLWGVSGLQFCSGGECVELFNALDELGITDAPETDPGTVRVEV